MRSINSFHNRLMLHHKVLYQKVITTESWSTFQFLGICSAEFRYSSGFFYQYVGKTHLISSGKKSINMAAVTEQTTEAFDWKLIGFIWRGRIHWNFSHSKSMVWCQQCIEEPLAVTLIRARWHQRNIDFGKLKISFNFCFNVETIYRQTGHTSMHQRKCAYKLCSVW